MEATYIALNAHVVARMDFLVYALFGMSVERDYQIGAIVGLGRGDEGKGRFVDKEAENYHIVARGQGGPNAGHTVLTDEGQELALHSVPSGIAREGVMNVIGRGCLIDAVKLAYEIDAIRRLGLPVEPSNLIISHGAHLILPHHVSTDELRESGPNAQGSTKSGIAPAAAAKFGRFEDEAFRAEAVVDNLDGLWRAIVAGLESQAEVRKANGLNAMKPEEYADKYIRSARKLGQFVGDTELYLHERLKSGDKVLVEGAQAFWLDPAHGMWPMVTSTPTTANGVFDGLGLPAHLYKTNVVGVIKLVQSHVGGGPFVTEVLDPELQKQLHGRSGLVDSEEGTTTGRKRRLGNLDLPGIRRAMLINGVGELAVTKLDWVPRFGESVKICTSYNFGDQKVDISPEGAKRLQACTPNYVELPTWTQNIQDVRRFKNLPKEARDYIEFIEGQLDIGISMIGVGPARSQAIDRR